MKCYSLSEINRSAREDPLIFIRKSEREYSRRLRTLAGKICSGNSRKILMLAGPSSSGKTTTAIKLARNIRLEGHRCFVVHLDDFYRNRNEISPGPDGKQDFESPESLNLPLLQETLQALAQDGRTALPEYDFTAGRRRDYVHPIHVRHGDAVIIEGLHALNPKIFEPLEETDSLYKAYVNISSSICNDEEDILFGPRDIRLLRRIIRDYNYRNSSVVNTFSMWPEVLKGEEKYLFPFEPDADIRIDSFHPYEVCVYKKTAMTLLQRVSQSGPYYAKAEGIMDNLAPVDPLSSLIVPRSSLIQEFIK